MPYVFFKFSIFLAPFFDRMLNFDGSSSKCSKKISKNIHFRCNVFRYIQSRRQNRPKYWGEAGQSEKSLHFWKMHNAKTQFLNWLKLCKEVGNYMSFWMERYWWLEISDRRFSLIFGNIPSLLGRFMRFIFTW